MGADTQGRGEHDGQQTEGAGRLEAVVPQSDDDQGEGGNNVAS